MKIAYIIYNGITWLDFIGIYDPISRLKSMNYIPDLTWDICSFTESIADNFGLEIKPNKINNDLSDYDVIIIPGGFAALNLQTDTVFIDWIKSASEVNYKISVCTGSLILGAAGFLKDKNATTHFDAYEILKSHCKNVSKKRIVEDGTVITSGAVSSSIDLGLYLCEKWAGNKAALAIQKSMDYSVKV